MRGFCRGAFYGGGFESGDRMGIEEVEEVFAVHAARTAFGGGSVQTMIAGDYQYLARTAVAGQQRFDF